MWNDTDIYDEETGTFYGYGEDEYTCPHGTYIGTPGGPDLMCHYCEMGYSREEFEDEMRWQRAHRTRQAAKEWFVHQAFAETSIIRTFQHIPGANDKEGSVSFIVWWRKIIEEIEAMTPSDLLLIEDEVVYNRSR